MKHRGGVVLSPEGVGRWFDRARWPGVKGKVRKSPNRKTNPGPVQKKSNFLDLIYDLGSSCKVALRPKKIGGPDTERILGLYLII